jgi:hypothetical protein
VYQSLGDRSVGIALLLVLGVSCSARVPRRGSKIGGDA